MNKRKTESNDAAAQEDAIGTSEDYPSRNSAVVVMTRRYRVFVFREFLLKTFGREYLGQGTILDVAGGKGDLSWLLANADGLDSIVVDPRVTDHTKLVRGAQWMLDNPETAKVREQSAPGSRDHSPLASLHLRPPFRTPRHLRMFMDNTCVENATNMERGGEEWAVYFKNASKRAEACEGQSMHHQPLGTESIDGERGRITCCVDAYVALLSARLVVGFHSDEATDSCINLALALRVPFVVVPCCVFPKAFPHRRLRGKPVSSYYDLVEYLKGMHPNIQQAELPFESEGGGARRTVLFMRPSDYDLRCVVIPSNSGGL